MTDEKKYTLEDDLRQASHDIVVAMNRGVLGHDRAALSTRLNKWAEGKDPNLPDVDLRDIKIGDEVTFETGISQELLKKVPISVGLWELEFRFGSNKTESGTYKIDGRPLNDRLRCIISYRTPPFDFQRSYDRGVRRFKKRDGTLTTELYWFKESESPHPVRDSYGCAWSSRGLRYQGMEGHPADLIAEAPAEAPAEVQPEGQGDA